MTPLFPPDRAPTEAQLRNKCGACHNTWHSCDCPADARTESIASLLSNKSLFPQASHLCVFIYHPYIRHAPLANASDFSSMALPVWEGWYGVWLKPSNLAAEIVAWSSVHVVNVEVVYMNGGVLNGFLDRFGELYVCVQGGKTGGGDGYDEIRQLVRVRVQVSLGLTREEVRTGCRGWLKRCDGRVDVERRVSHVVREEGDEFVVRLLREGGRESVVKAEGKGWGGIEEFRWRGRRRFCKRVAKVLQLYLAEMCRRAGERDEAARFVLKRGWGGEGGGREVKRLKMVLDKAKVEGKEEDGRRMLGR